MAARTAMLGLCIAALGLVRLALAVDDEIADVATLKEFAAAVASGAAHIRVLEHMDLRSLELENLCTNLECANLLLFRMQETTASIQVSTRCNCAWLRTS